MIIKYKNEDAWTYADKVNHAKTDGETYPNQILMIFEVEIKENEPIDGTIMSIGEAISYKVFGILDRKLSREYFNNIRCMNLISPSGAEANKPIKTIILNIGSGKENYVAALITNQDVFLMNDKGQTIERLS